MYNDPIFRFGLPMSTYVEEQNKRIKRISAGAVILRQTDSGWHALLLRAWSHWDFPKGNVEHGESLMQAALREVKEETGITELSFPWGHALARTNIYSKDKVAYYAIAQTQGSEVLLLPNPETGVKEHDEFRWVPWDQIQQMLSPRLHGILQWVSSNTGLPNPLVHLAQASHFAQLADSQGLSMEGSGSLKETAPCSPKDATLLLAPPPPLGSEPLAPSSKEPARAPGKRRRFRGGRQKHGVSKRKP